MVVLAGTTMVEVVLVAATIVDVVIVEVFQPGTVGAQPAGPKPAWSAPSPCIVM